MQPYPTVQNYGQFYPPMGNQIGYPVQNSFSDRQIPQFQMPQSVAQPVNPLASQFQGKIVDSIDSVKATDIPMDGNSYYFPKADGTEVYSKRWLPNGRTEVITYTPVVEASQEEQKIPSEELLNDIIKRFDVIDEKFDKLEKLLQKGSQKAPKKEE